MIKYHLDTILIFAFFTFIVGGMGYLIIQDSYQNERKYNTCIAAGNQYINGNCVK